jgi:predicted AAA+ superfamily ATPase
MCGTPKTLIPLVKGQKLIFFDEVQERGEIVTAIKFLVEEGCFPLCFERLAAWN